MTPPGEPGDDGPVDAEMVQQGDHSGARVLDPPDAFGARGPSVAEYVGSDEAVVLSEWSVEAGEGEVGVPCPAVQEYDGEGAVLRARVADAHAA